MYMPHPPLSFVISPVIVGSCVLSIKIPSHSSVTPGFNGVPIKELEHLRPFPSIIVSFPAEPVILNGVSDI